MTPEEENVQLKEIVANLVNGYQQLHQGIQFMTDVVVKLERRVADLERDDASKPKIIHPYSMRQ